MPADILLYALIAAGLIFWLRNILGTRDEDDDGVGMMSDSEENKDAFIPTPLKKSKNDESNVVSLNAVVGQRFDLPRHIRIDNKTAENMLEDIAKKHPSFDIYHFLDGAQYAFPMIIEAFAQGDKETLKNILETPVYDAFEKAIDDREKRGEKVETEVKSVEKIDVTDVRLKGDVLYITVRFTAREICVIRDADGNIVSGNPERITEMVDVWVFSNDLSAGEPEWYLHETRDDEVEDHKTPLPEAGKEKD